MIIFTIVTVIIGFMLAIQFQTTNEPNVRDTRDILQLRQDLRVEKERQQQLNMEIEKQLTLLNQLKQKENIEDVMIDALEDLRANAGLKEISGEGIIIEISPMFSDYTFGSQTQSVPPNLLRFLINELNIHGAKEIAIGNQRITSTTAIREVAGITQINARRVTGLPLQVKVLSDDAEKLHHEMIVSQSVEYFEIENLRFTSTPVNHIELPPYDQVIRVRHLHPVKEES